MTIISAKDRCHLATFYVDDQAAVLVRHVDVINVDDDVAVQVHGDGEGL